MAGGERGWQGVAYEVAGGGSRAQEVGVNRRQVAA